jgi:hypothetical protein
MKNAILCLVLVGSLGCSRLAETKSAAERAADALECKTEVIRPYFDDVQEARRFALALMAGHINPADALRLFRELGTLEAEVEDVVRRFRACTPGAQAAPEAPAPVTS